MMTSMISNLYKKLKPEQRKTLSLITDNDQEHLLKGWDTEPEYKIHNLLNIIADFDRKYPGGMTQYLKNARNLISESQNGINPLKGFTPQIPQSVRLDKLDHAYREYEEIGSQCFGETGIVLVAGGLGERLGYSGIKIEIPVETICGTSYIELYAELIKAMESYSGKANIPLIIMTSADTHNKTTALLEQKDFFGLNKQQIHILKQDLVPAIASPDGKLALSAPLELLQKPHGHGDIHLLLYNSGILKPLKDQGIRYLFFIQDTNAQIVNSLAAALGVSETQNFVFNTLAVNRIPKEEVGAICRLTRDTSEMTVNVEYNQLDPLLKATVDSEGDKADETGNSPYPGNTNLLLIQLAPYIDVLSQTQGLIPEFINPKYTDQTKTCFKKPARLETMMQDLPKLFKEGQATGVSIFNRRWCFSANKNNISTAMDKLSSQKPPEYAGSAEVDLYEASRLKMLSVCQDLKNMSSELKGGIPSGPSIYLSSQFALTFKEVESKISKISIADHCQLVIKGKNIRIHNVRMERNSALIIETGKKVSLDIEDLTIANNGYCWEKISDFSQPEFIQLRGYRPKNTGALNIKIHNPGHYKLQSDYSIVKISNEHKEIK